MADAEPKPIEPLPPANAILPDNSPPGSLKYEPVNKGVSQIIAIGFVILLIAAVNIIEKLLPRHSGGLITGIYLGIFALFLLLKLTRVFFGAQSRTIEWLVSLFFAGFLMAAGKTFLDRFNTFDAGTNRTIMLIMAGVAIVWSLGGAVWGWHLAKRMNENGTRRRLWFICAAWLVVPAIAGFGGVCIAGIGMLTNDPQMNSPLAFVLSLAAIALGIPAWRLDKAAPLLASKSTMASVYKPAVIDSYETCRFGPRPLRWASVLLELVGFKLLFLPIIMHRSLKQKKKIELKEVQLSSLPKTVAEFFQEMDEPLRSAGFGLKHHSQLMGAKNVVTFGAYYTHATLGQVGYLAATYLLTHQGAQLYRCSLNITTKASAQLVVVTDNSCEFGFPFRNPQRKQMSFPEIFDLPLLHRVHNARSKKLGITGPGILSNEGQELPDMSVATQKLADLEHATLKPVLKTLLGTWSIVWPASLVREYLTRRRARAEMIALGFGDRLP